jgi:hypothetical protein
MHEMPCQCVEGVLLFAPIACRTAEPMAGPTRCGTHRKMFPCMMILPMLSAREILRVQRMPCDLSQSTPERSLREMTDSCHPSNRSRPTPLPRTLTALFRARPILLLSAAVPAAAEPAPDRPTCAVLPFENLTRRAGSRYLADVIGQGLPPALLQADTWRLVAYRRTGSTRVVEVATSERAALAACV